MITTDRKVRKLMQKYQKTGNISKSALHADLDPKTARKYIKSGKLPSSMKKDRNWRTRKDPFEGHWGECEKMLQFAPELEAKSIFDWICEKYPGLYQESQLRTFQRRVSDWRALKGPEKQVYFPQVHKPGKRMSTDFTHMDKLKVTICGEVFEHLLCHCVLTYSNWEWVEICYSESMLALRKGIQSTLFRLGKTPQEHWTDHSTAATHTPDQSKTERSFNKTYLEMMDHFGMIPKTIQVGEAHENGDVESLNGVLKRRIEQHLLLRGSRDFESVKLYESFLHEVLMKANRMRSIRVSEEMKEMKEIRVNRLPEYVEETSSVRPSSTITIQRRIYSVPSRLIGKTVRIKRYEDHIEVYYKGKRQLKTNWMRGEVFHQINYRHIIDSLARKPGAFRNYRYHQDLFPTLNFRYAYDALNRHLTPRSADREYLKILKLSAMTMESEVDVALSLLLESKIQPRWDQVMDLCACSQPEAIALKAYEVKLTEYDRLYQNEKVAA